MSVLVPVLVVTMMLAGLLLGVVGLPGNWLIVAVVGLYAYLAPTEWAAAIGWKTVGATVVLALLGEGVEFFAGAAGTAKAGGSRRATLLALVGSLVGGIAGIFVGLPIPLVGSLVAAIVFAGVGAMAGAMMGEGWAGKGLDDSWATGKGAFLGRVLGTVGKIFLGTLIVFTVVLAMIF